MHGLQTGEQAAVIPFPTKRSVAGYEWLKYQAKDIRGTVLNCGSAGDEQHLSTLFLSASQYRRLDIDPECRPDFVADVQKMPQVPSSSEDCLVVHRMIEQVPNVEAALLEFQRVMKPNGVLLISFAGPAYNDTRFHRFMIGEPEQLISKFFEIKALHRFFEDLVLSCTYIRAVKK